MGPPLSHPRRGFDPHPPPKVVLEALGSHGAQPGHELEAVTFLSRILANPRVDGGARAVAARSLSQLAALNLNPYSYPNSDSDSYPRSNKSGVQQELRDALSTAVDTLVTTLALDGDRYVRAHAFEALASFALGESVADDLIEELAADSKPQDKVRHSRTNAMACALRALLSCTPEIYLKQAFARSAFGREAAHGAVRQLSSLRRCPITTPESPF